MQFAVQQKRGVEHVLHKLHVLVAPDVQRMYHMNNYANTDKLYAQTAKTSFVCVCW